MTPIAQIAFCPLPTGRSFVLEVQRCKRDTFKDAAAPAPSYEPGKSAGVW